MAKTTARTLLRRSARTGWAGRMFNYRSLIARFGWLDSLAQCFSGETRYVKFLVIILLIILFAALPC